MVAPQIMDEAAALGLTDGQQWARDHAQKIIDELTPGESGEMEQSARQRLKNARETVAQIDTALQKRRAGHRRHAISSGNSGPIRNMLAEAAPHISVTLDDMDADPMLVNCENGTLRFWADEDKAAQLRDEGCSDLEEAGAIGVELRDHDRADRLSKRVAAAYDPSARAPQFERFMEVIQPDPEMRTFIQRWLGYSMLGLTREQRLAFFYGGGRNGKSTLSDLIAGILDDYSATAKIESLTGDSKRKGGEATPDLVPLIGARFVRASEPWMDVDWDPGLIKEMTGGEPMLVRALNKDFVEVTPIFKLSISGNHKPEIRGTDDGIWRRVMLVPFDVQIDKDAVDRDLPAKLWAERAGVLNWLIEGALQYLARGLAEPAGVLAATEEFRAESDPIGGFLASCIECTTDDADRISAKDMTAAVRLYQVENGTGMWGERTISARINEAKVDKWRHPINGLTFGRVKSGGIWQLTRCRFTPEFQLLLDAKGAPKSQGGQ